MESMTKEIIYQGNSIISIETLPEYSHPTVIKRPSKPDTSRQHILALEKEYEMTRSLDKVEGVRQVFEHQSIENQPVLILEYIDGETLRDLIASETLNLRSRLEIAVELTRIRAGATALGVGSSLVNQKLLDSGDLAELTRRARAFIEAVKNGR